MSDNIYFERGEAPKEIRYSEEFALHLDRMTVEKLHSKSHIALELARRDIENTRLKERVKGLDKSRAKIRQEVYNEIAQAKASAYDNGDIEAGDNLLVLIDHLETNEKDRIYKPNTGE